MAEALEPYTVSLGVTHSAVITRSGELFTSGSKLDGQLGVKFVQNHTRTSSLSRGDSHSFLNQFKDQKELKEMAAPINRVGFFGKDNRAV